MVIMKIKLSTFSPLLNDWTENDPKVVSLVSSCRFLMTSPLCPECLPHVYEQHLPEAHDQ